MSLHQEVCDKLGIKRAELAEILGISKATIDSWSDEERISSMAKKAMELLIENHDLKEVIGGFEKSIKYFVGNNNGQDLSFEHKNLIKRLNYVIEEYEINIIEAAKMLGCKNFGFLDKILKFQATPNFEFLENFAKTFNLSYNWLLKGDIEKEKPFAHFLDCGNSLKKLSEKLELYSKIYIVYSKSRNKYTKIIVENKNKEFDIFETDFCVMDETAILEWREKADICDLYDFFSKNKDLNRDIIKIKVLNDDEYEKIMSEEHYIGSILSKNHEYDTKLNALFALNESYITDECEKGNTKYKECFEILRKHVVKV